MHITFDKAPPAGDALAVGLWQGRQWPDGEDVHLAAALAACPRFTGGEGETAAGFMADGRRLVFLGLGPRDGADARRAERLGAALYDAVKMARRLVVRPGLADALAAPLAFGLRHAAWRPPAELRRPGDEDPCLEEVVVAGDGVAWSDLDRLAECQEMARELAVLPGNLLGPEEFERHARALEALGCTVQVLDANELNRAGLNLLAAVGQGSARPPRLVAVRWQGGAGAPLALVGKGITFDTGGISIKHGEMHDMKGDMAGAAAALMALRCLALSRAPVNAAAVLAIAENMPSGVALRPGDVIRSYAGRTVEVVDTDAEGRLVLADALAWTCAQLKPRAVIDLATLTGAIVTTLGRHHGGLFCNDEALADRLLAAGRASGEALWRLPLSEGHDEALKSDIADIRNCAWGRVPDALHAARFLQGFVPEGMPWAHLDIAGVAEDGENKRPTGFGVRLLVETAVRP